MGDSQLFPNLTNKPSWLSPHVTWLTPLQVERMNKTEALGTRYFLCEIESVSCWGTVVVTKAFASMFGAAALGGAPLGLGAANVSGSSLRRGTQVDAWKLVAADTGLADDGVGLSKLVLLDDGVGEKVRQYLRKNAVLDRFVFSKRQR